MNENRLRRGSSPVVRICSPTARRKNRSVSAIGRSASPATNSASPSAGATDRTGGRHGYFMLLASLNASALLHTLVEAFTCR